MITELRKIKKLLASPGAWTKGALARNAAGCRVEPWSEDANRWCLLGAIEKLAPTKGVGNSIERLFKQELKYEGRYFHVEDFNDSWRRTHEEVLDFIDAAIKAAEKKERKIDEDA